MNTIKFSHEYPKLHGQTSAELLAVRPIKIDAHTPKELLEYDTTYDGGRYPLKSGDYIQLVFLGNLRIPFCTIRKAWPPQKIEYYKAAIGHDFAIHVKEEGGEKWLLTSTIMPARQKASRSMLSILRLQ